MQRKRGVQRCVIQWPARLVFLTVDIFYDEQALMMLKKYF